MVKSVDMTDLERRWHGKRVFCPRCNRFGTLQYRLTKQRQIDRTYYDTRAWYIKHNSLETCYVGKTLDKFLEQMQTQTKNLEYSAENGKQSKLGQCVFVCKKQQNFLNAWLDFKAKRVVIVQAAFAIIVRGFHVFRFNVAEILRIGTQSKKRIGESK